MSERIYKQIRKIVLMRIIFDGQEAFSEYKKLLRSAKKSIWICMYMIRFDDYLEEL